MDEELNACALSKMLASGECLASEHTSQGTAIRLSSLPIARQLGYFDSGVDVIIGKRTSTMLLFENRLLLSIVMQCAGVLLDIC